jgi:hypothetical protein
MNHQQTVQLNPMVTDSSHPPYVARAYKVGKILQQQISATLAQRMDEASLLPAFFDNKVLLEYLHLQQAISSRILDYQANWLTGMVGITQEYQELKEANTLSKHVAQECNILGMWNALFTQQAVNCAEMMENIQTDYSYWLSQKTSAA